MKLIGIAGLARSGKDTAAAYLADKIGLHQYSFAAPMKDMLTKAFGDHFYTGDRERICPEAGVSYRTLMQTIGTEWGRNINPNLWVNLVAKRWEWVKSGSPVSSVIGELSNLRMGDELVTRGMILSDVRFDSEAQWVKDQGGIVIHIIRDGQSSVGIEGHASEAGISPGLATYVVNNNSDLPGLYRRLDTLIGSIYGR